MQYIWTFLIGGALCAIAQALIDKCKLTPARILVLYVSLGTFLTLLGWYEPLVRLAGAGATVPLTGFGYCLARGVIKAITENGPIGILTGGLTGAAAGITAAVVFGYLAALICKPRSK